MFSALASRDEWALGQALAEGADPNARQERSDSMTALMCAASEPFAEGVRRLVEAGARLEDRDYQGWTALHHAS